MSPSATLTRDGVVGSRSLIIPDVHRSLTDGAIARGGARSRSALLKHAHLHLRTLALRQTRRDDTSFATVLRLIAALTQDGSATPQISSNGEGGILVEWLVAGSSLAIDYEDETEILISAATPAGLRFAETMTSWWSQGDSAVVKARAFLSEISAAVARPIPLI